MNTSTIASAILAAILAVALLIPGIDALKTSLEGFIATKKNEVSEQCEVVVAQQKVFGAAANQVLRDCLKMKTDAVDANFKVGVDMLEAFRAALDKVNPTTP